MLSKHGIMLQFVCDFSRNCSNLYSRRMKKTVIPPHPPSHPPCKNLNSCIPLIFPL